MSCGRIRLPSRLLGEGQPVHRVAQEQKVALVADRVHGREVGLGVG